MIRLLAPLGVALARAALVVSLATAPVLAQIQPSAPVASKGYVDTGLAAGIAATALEKPRAQAAEGLLLPKTGGLMTGPVVLSPGSTGPVDGMSVTPTGSGISVALSDLFAVLRPHAATNAALKTSGTWFSSIRRNGFYAAGDGGTMDYTWSASNCTKADDGAQVQPLGRTGCWIADPNVTIYPEVWGTQSTGTFDDGPALRAAITYCGTSGRDLRLRRKFYAVNSLDASGLGGIVEGTGADGDNAPTCHVRGDSPDMLPDNVFKFGPVIALGAGLNRPLLYIRKNARTAMWADLALSGNRAAQTGWSGGPGGKLYTVQLEDDGAAQGKVESAWQARNIIVRDGYNGNIYDGYGRGGMWLHDVWSQYSGQTTADFSIVWAGYDGVAYNLQIGSNAGGGQFFASGSQYQQYGGAIFLNGGFGTNINGHKVNYLSQDGMNYQSNNGAITIQSSSAYSAQTGGGHLFSKIVFDGNSYKTAGAVSDVVIADNTVATFVQPVFLGSAASPAVGLPKYNLEISGSSRVYVTEPSFGTATATNTLGFTNGCGFLITNANVTCSWTPILKGGTTAGTPTYSIQNGTYSRNGNVITTTFNVQTLALGGMAGSVNIGGLPLFSTTATNDFGACDFSSYSGWTAPAGYSTIGGIISPNSNTINFVRNGSGQSSATMDSAELAASSRLWGKCVYHTDK